MPTLFRMFIAIAILGGAFLGLLAYLGSMSEPDFEEVSVDVPAERIGKSSALQNGSH